MKITPADHWMSMCVRERANWTCERCGREYGSFPAPGLDCAHYETRDEWALRFEPLNCFSLCRGCHGYFDRERRFEFEEFYLKKMGEEALAILREKACDPGGLGKEVKRTRGRGEIARHFEEEYNRMLKLRAEGVQGRVEFVGW